jgi:hypothetical protein
MNTNLELDGENISIEQTSPSDRRRTLDQDDFYPADGLINQADSDGRITMVAAVAGQNTGNYFDQDNFYPADGKKDGVLRSVGQIYGNAARGAAGFLSKEEIEKRKAIRKENKSVKNKEALSRAELNKSLGQDKASDVELAKALKGDDTSKSTTSQPMSKNTKIAIGVTAVLVLGTIVYFVVRKKK